MTWGRIHLACNTWSKIAIKVPSIVSGDRETPPSSSHLSWWNFHPIWSQVFRKSWAFLLPACSQPAMLHHMHSPSQRWLCNTSFVVNLQSTWETQHWTFCALLSSSQQPVSSSCVQELPWGSSLFLSIVEGYQRQPWLDGAVPSRRCETKGWLHGCSGLIWMSCGYEINFTSETECRSNSLWRQWAMTYPIKREKCSLGLFNSPKDSWISWEKSCIQVVILNVNCLKQTNDK